MGSSVSRTNASSKICACVTLYVPLSPATVSSWEMSATSSSGGAVICVGLTPTSKHAVYNIELGMDSPFGPRLCSRQQGTPKPTMIRRL